MRLSDLGGEFSVLLCVEGDELHFVVDLQLLHYNVLILPEPLVLVPDNLDAAIHITLYLPRHFLNTLLHGPLPLLHQLSDAIKLLPELLFDASNEVGHFILPLQHLPLNLNMLRLPAPRLLQQPLQILHKSRARLPQSLDLVAAVAAMNDALGADGRALAGEAVVTDIFIWMLAARYLVGLRGMRVRVVGR